MNGKNKCKLLKEIRRQIAKANDISYVTSECRHQGDCSGTCPKCEAEVRYLEEELRKRQRLGKSVAVAGIAASLMVTVSGCDLPFISTTAGAPLPPDTQSQTEQVDGEMPMPPGAIVLPENTETEPSETEELMGDPVYEYEGTE